MLVVLLVAVSGCATVQTQTAPTSTLDKLTATRTIALGYRESSIPFSYVSADTTPVGYSVELCTRIVADLQRQIPDLQVQWVPVTVENRIPALLAGTIDLECGSTTNTLARQEQVDFSLTTFLTGGSLLTLAEAPRGGRSPQPPHRRDPRHDDGAGAQGCSDAERRGGPVPRRPRSCRGARSA